MLRVERAAQDLALIRGGITFGHVPTQRQREKAGEEEEEVTVQTTEEEQSPARSRMAEKKVR